MWEIIGYEVSSNSEGVVTGYSIYCTKSFKGESGKGKFARRFWYRANIGYKPVLGEKVFVDVSIRTGAGGKQFESVDDVYKV